MDSAKKRGLISQVTDLLREEITTGRWEVGSRIPTEPELVEYTGAGRNTVREAVQALVHAGMLERRQGSGTYVLAGSSVTAVLRREIDPTRRRELLEVRQALEVTAAAFAASRRDEHDIAAMRTLLADIERHHGSGDLGAAGRSDADLHHALIIAGHNTTYLEVYEGLLPTVEFEMIAEIADSGTVFPHEHTGLVDAIEAGDPELAAARMHNFFATLLGRELGERFG